MNFKRLTQKQKENGAFQNTKDEDSLFITSLILLNLNHLQKNQESTKVKNKAYKWLIGQKNNDWVFSANNMAVNFFVLTSLLQHNPEVADGTALAKILTTLTSIESKEGGPYYSSIDKKDTSIDIGVNIAIAYFLSLQDVSLPELDKLIEKSVEKNSFNSKFFTNEYLNIYLITQFYKGNKKQTIIDYLLKKKQGDGWNNILNNSLAILSLLKLGYPKERLATEINYVKNSKDNLNQEYPLYIDKNNKLINSTQELNKVFYLMVLENIDVYDVPINNIKNGDKKMIDIILKEAEKRFSSLDSDMKNIAMREISKTLKGNKDRQMSLMPYYTKQALGKKAGSISDNLIASMGLANIFFWTAFIIYDDFWDEDEMANPQILPTANFYARNFTQFFTSLLPKETSFNKLFTELMDKLDAANTWETISCRTKVDGNKFIIPKILPEYGDYEFKYRPASGHILGPVAILYLLGYDKNSKEVLDLIKYFRHYLIAMQINDDAHDWEEDMQRGHLSTVVVILLQDWKEKYPDKNEIDLKEDSEELKKIFWFKTIKKACEKAVIHTKQSREALDSMTILEDSSPLEHFINIAEDAARKALDEQKNSMKFLEEFSKK